MQQNSSFAKNIASRLISQIVVLQLESLESSSPERQKSLVEMAIEKAEALSELLSQPEHK